MRSQYYALVNEVRNILARPDRKLADLLTGWVRGYNRFTRDDLKRIGYDISNSEHYDYVHIFKTLYESAFIYYDALCVIAKEEKAHYMALELLTRLVSSCYNSGKFLINYAGEIAKDAEECLISFGKRKPNNSFSDFVCQIWAKKPERFGCAYQIATYFKYLGAKDDSYSSAAAQNMIDTINETNSLDVDVTSECMIVMKRVISNWFPVFKTISKETIIRNMDDPGYGSGADSDFGKCGDFIKTITTVLPPGFLDWLSQWKVSVQDLGIILPNDVIDRRTLDPVTGKRLWVKGQALQHRDSMMFHAVPKNLLKKRGIAANPAGYMLAQKETRAFMMHLLSDDAKRHIHLDDQSYNSKLALQSSATNKYATKDFSAASDRITVKHVEFLFPAYLSSLLMAVRPKSMTIQINSNRTEVLEVDGMFNTMGCDTCFPVETIVFAALCSAAIILSRRGQDRISRYMNLGLTEKQAMMRLIRSTKFFVYGDDCIVPVWASKKFDELAKVINFKLNKEKSFDSTVNGHCFRESCGMFALNGINITPLKVSKKAELITSDITSTIQLSRLVSVVNAAARYGYTSFRRLRMNQLRNSTIIDSDGVRHQPMQCIPQQSLHVLDVVTGEEEVAYRDDRIIVANPRPIKEHDSHGTATAHRIYQRSLDREEKYDILWQKARLIESYQNLHAIDFIQAYGRYTSLRLMRDPHYRLKDSNVWKEHNWFKALHEEKGSHETLSSRIDKQIEVRSVNYFPNVPRDNDIVII